MDGLCADKQTVKWKPSTPFTRYNLLSNRLYRVNGVFNCSTSYLLTRLNVEANFSKRILHITCIQRLLMMTWRPLLSADIALFLVNFCVIVLLQLTSAVPWTRRSMSLSLEFVLNSISGLPFYSQHNLREYFWYCNKNKNNLQKVVINFASRPIVNYIEQFRSDLKTLLVRSRRNLVGMLSLLYFLLIFVNFCTVDIIPTSRLSILSSSACQLWFHIKFLHRSSVKTVNFSLPLTLYSILLICHVDAFVHFFELFNGFSNSLNLSLTQLTDVFELIKQKVVGSTFYRKLNKTKNIFSKLERLDQICVKLNKTKIKPQFSVDSEITR